MKKLCVLFVIGMMLFALGACSSETVELHCDGENCNKTVEVKYKDGEEPDESWVVFCEECAGNSLED